MTTLKKIRRSRTVPLVFATAAAVTACGDNAQETTSLRDEYKNLEDCTKDWGSIDPCSPEVAQQGNTLLGSGHGSTYTGHYFGPSYAEGNREQAQRGYNPNIFSSNNNNTTAGVGTSNFNSTNSANGTNTSNDHAIGRSVSRSGGSGGRSVSRGGFGGTAHGFSGGG